MMSQRMSVLSLVNVRQAALEAGVAKENIWIDPGFGFAKNVQHNIDLLRGLDKVVGLGYPVLFGFLVSVLWIFS